MNKESMFEQQSPLQLLLQSGLVGAGGFGAMRLLKELSETAKANGPRDGEDENSLTIDMPRPQGHQQHSQMPKMGEEGLTFEKVLALGVGAPLGFLGAKGVYDKVKKKQLDGEIETANNKYMKTLSNYKAGEATPAVDAFCEGIAESFGKVAEFDFMSPEALSSLPKGEADPMASLGHGQQKDFFEKLLSKNLGQDTMHVATLGQDGNIGNAWKGTAGLAALLAFGGMTLADKKREKSEKSREFPSTVKLNYQ